MARVTATKNFPVDVTIANGESLSDATTLNSGWPVGIVIPVAWTAADLSFDVSWDNGSTFAPLFDDGGEVTVPSAVIPTAEVRYIAIDPTKFHGATDLKIRSGLLGAEVNQGDERILTVVRASR